ncbi:MAG: 2-succinyl-5-enolpyruvyl-6-hydroxy-3-cyclohexene-1-carboxylic-acid synthase [Myxococcota bacterium]|nr:2-succinyl-5-enolpyruvyl-6-hydroxy-3-cyclohexene-1-carboxylic-acid synthase [Myxococcota bacterium]
MSVELAPNANIAFSEAFFDELARAGVRHVCICPGSRSAPLAIAAAGHAALRSWSHVDERSAAFFALGLAKATRAPVALVCTSGTAAANFHPAVVEAHHARVPLLVLTADRPPELRGWGAGQTIDQINLYGSAVRWFAEAPVPEASDAGLRHARALACRAVATAAGAPAGPVHLNLPFRDPLDPRRVQGDVASGLPERVSEGRGLLPYTAAAQAVSPPGPELTARLAERVRASERGVISCGPLDRPDAADAIAGLARALGWPLLAEPTSQLRRGAFVPDAPVVATSDLFLRDDRTAARLAPDFVLRFGDTPTSKFLRLWLERHRPDDLVVVDPDGAWHDPSHLASAVLQVDPVALCDALQRRLGRHRGSPQWLECVLDVEARTVGAVDAALAGNEGIFEPRAVRELAAALPENALLYVSNSMPVRDLDAFLPPAAQPLRVLANRGANGIDGMVSSALGAGAGCSGAPVVLLTGDLAFLHDAGGLLAAHRHGLSATVVVFDNDGGGIFSFLPVARFGESVGFEEHFRTPPGLDLGAMARAYGASFTRVASWEHFRAALKEGLSTEGVSVVSLPVDRDASVEHHRAIDRAVAAALDGVGGVRHEATEPLGGGSVLHGEDGTR